MSKIRIAHVIDASSFNSLLFNSIKYSDRNKFEYYVITLDPPGALMDQMKELGVEAFSVNYRSKKSLPRVTLQMRKFFRKNKIDIVQSHLLRSSLIGFTAARLAGVKVKIFTGHHSHEIPLHNRKFLTWLDGLCGRRLSNYTIAPSRDMRNIFIKYQKVPAKKIAVIPHGFDLPHWREAADGEDIKKELGIENKTVFGAVGRLFWVKDFATLIEAFSRIAGNYEDVVLVIAGDGNEKESLLKIAGEKKLGSRVIFTGRRTDMARVMKGFDVFVHTSIAESFGMVYIEAFALGKPTISTKVGVAPDIIRDGVNGYFIEKKNPDDLAAKMRLMLDQRDKWMSMGDNGKKVAEDFAVQKTQAQCDEFYLKCLSSR
jgi:glycosyltransferase involved in cell wall biosynthesis